MRRARTTLVALVLLGLLAGCEHVRQVNIFARIKTEKKMSKRKRPPKFGHAQNYPEWKRVRGYRIEVCVVLDPKSATRARNRVISKWNEHEVYIIPQKGKYFVRVGNFRSRKDARECRKRLMEKGFDTSMVVESDIWIEK